MHEKKSASDEAEMGNTPEYIELCAKYNFIQSQFNHFVEIVESEAGKDILEKSIRKLGCKCAQSVGFIKAHKGDIEGYCKELHAKWGEVVIYNKEKGQINVITPERECVCALVKQGQTTGDFCNCSLGWQKYAFETILERTVDVRIIESSLRGSKRCQFEIKIVS